MMIIEMKRGTDADNDRLLAKLARSCVIQNAFQVDSLTKSIKEKWAISECKEKKKLDWRSISMVFATAIVFLAALHAKRVH
jgi:hypothetical protein